MSLIVATLLIPPSWSNQLSGPGFSGGRNWPAQQFVVYRLLSRFSYFLQLPSWYSACVSALFCTAVLKSIIGDMPHDRLVNLSLGYWATCRHLPDSFTHGINTGAQIS